MQRIRVSRSFDKALEYGLTNCNCLEHFVWSNSTLSESLDVYQLAKMIVKKGCSLKSLEIGNHKLKDNQLVNFLGSLRTHPSLTSVRIRIQDLNQCLLDAIHDLANTSHQSNNLETLELCIQHNWWDSLHKLPSTGRIKYNIDPIIVVKDEKIMRYIGRVLNQNPMISSFDLSHKGLSNENIVALSSRLADTKGLKSLRIHGNQIETTGANQLLSAMKSNIYIEEIQLPFCCDREIAKKIHHCCDLNRIRRTLLLDVRVPTSLWPLVLERAGNKALYLQQGMKEDNSEERKSSVIYHLLHGPATLHTGTSRTCSETS